VQIEAFWPTGNNLPPCAGPANALQNDTVYRFRIVVSDEGDIHYAVTPSGSQTPILQESLNASPLFPAGHPFPVDQTGYFFVPATTASADYTVYMSSLSVTWSR